MTLRERILNARDFKIEPVQAWGETLYVRTMTGFDRANLVAEMNKVEKTPLEMMKLVPLVFVFVACDQDGKKVFNLEDAEAISQKDWETVDSVATAGLKLNGFLDAKKNSVKTSDSNSQSVAESVTPAGD